MTTKNNRSIHAIATRYDGTIFRSRMEAYFAKWCNSWDIQWCYEPEGYEFNGTRYLPDFYLPESNVIVEVKPIIAMNEASKIKELMDHIGANKLPDDGCDEDVYYKNRKEAWVVQVDKKGCIFNACQVDYGWESKIGYHYSAGPVLCVACNKPYIVGCQVWDCRHCGNYNFNRSFHSGLEWGLYGDSDDKSNFAPYGNK